MLNPNKKIKESSGVDLPILYVYLAGRISGENIDLCLNWRNQIIQHYKNYKNSDSSYPIGFLSPLNSGEADTVDAKGLTSAIPPNLIYDKDLLSVERADVIIANMDDFFETDIQDLISENSEKEYAPMNYIDGYRRLKDKILNRRENIGTVFEIAWAMYLQKPLILIVPEKRKEIFMKHPFTKRASVIVTSVNQLLKEKYLQILYKSISGAVDS